MNTIEVTLVTGVEVDGKLISEQPAETGVLTLNELHDMLNDLTDGSPLLSKKELKAIVKKHDHTVAVLVVQDCVDTTSNHVWVVSHVQFAGMKEAVPNLRSQLGCLSTAPSAGAYAS